MPYRYRCARCATTSRPYSTRRQADLHGHRHRDEVHGGDHPDGERIVHVPHRPPGRSELVAAVVFVVLVVAALVNKYG